MTKEFEVALLIKEKLLTLHFALLFLFTDPLLLEHGSLNFGKLALLMLDLGASVLLPIKNGLSVLDELLLLLNFLALTLLLSEEVQLPQLSVDMLLHDLVLSQALLVDQLLLALHLALQDEEFPGFLAEIVGC